MPSSPATGAPADRRVVGVAQQGHRERAVGADRAAPEEHLGLGDDLAPRLEHVGDRHLRGPVEHDAERAVVVDVEQQHDGVGEVGVQQCRRRHQQHPRMRACHALHHGRSADRERLRRPSDGLGAAARRATAARRPGAQPRRAAGAGDVATAAHRARSRRPTRWRPRSPRRAGAARPSRRASRAPWRWRRPWRAAISASSGWAPWWSRTPGCRAAPRRRRARRGRRRPRGRAAGRRAALDRGRRGGCASAAAGRRAGSSSSPKVSATPVDVDREEAVEAVRRRWRITSRRIVAAAVVGLPGHGGLLRVSHTEGTYSQYAPVAVCQPAA